MLYTTSSRKPNYAKDPAVVRLGDTYYLYYSIPGTGGPDENGWEGGWSVGIAQSTDLENWEEVGVLASSQPCDERGLAAPGAIVLDGQVHLFYQTYGNGKGDAICHAVSTDGVPLCERSHESGLFAQSYLVLRQGYRRGCLCLPGKALFVLCHPGP